MKIDKETILQGKINGLGNEINKCLFIISNAKDPRKIEKAEKDIPILERKIKELYDEKHKLFPILSKAVPKPKPGLHGSC